MYFSPEKGSCWRYWLWSNWWGEENWCCPYTREAWWRMHSYTKQPGLLQLWWSFKLQVCLLTLSSHGFIALSYSYLILDVSAMLFPVQKKSCHTCTFTHKETYILVDLLGLKLPQKACLMLAQKLCHNILNSISQKQGLLLFVEGLINDTPSTLLHGRISVHRRISVHHIVTMIRDCTIFTLKMANLKKKISHKFSN